MTTNRFAPRAAGRPALQACLAFCALSVALLAADPAAAFDVVPSGFGTLGYARSDRSANYERFIDENGTWERDSVFGLQLDARVNAQWSATLQLRAAPSFESDSRWELRPTWAFIGWRPSDDWLIRVGRMRAPLYMYSESLDVGVTHDLARLPTEMYSIAPTNDFDGYSVGKTWQRGDNEWSVDAFQGKVRTATRAWLRDGLPGVQPAGVLFSAIDANVSGIVFTFRQPRGQWRLSWHRTSARSPDGTGIPVSYPFVSIGPGLGYYQVSNQLPGPGLTTVSRVRNHILTLGVEQSLPAGVRLAAEAERTLQRDIEGGTDTYGGYVAVFRPFGSVTPYLAWGLLRSTGRHLDAYDNLTRNPLPDGIPGAAAINAAQRITAETIYGVSDQHSLALGGAWALSAEQKLKLEWKRTHIGRNSRFVDANPGEDVRGTKLDILSVNYSFAF